MERKRRKTGRGKEKRMRVRETKWRGRKGDRIKGMLLEYSGNNEQMWRNMGVSRRI